VFVCLPNAIIVVVRVDVSVSRASVKFQECRSSRGTGQTAINGRELQGGTNRKEDRAGDSKDEVQLSVLAKKTR